MLKRVLAMMKWSRRPKDEQSEIVASEVHERERREKELYAREHELARTVHVLEWQAQGITPRMKGRPKSPE